MAVAINRRRTRPGAEGVLGVLQEADRGAWTHCSMKRARQSPDQVALPLNAKIPGIYRVTIIVDGALHAIYLGGSQNCHKRWQKHLSALRNGKHPNVRLQRAFVLYREPAFRFEIIEVCTSDYRVSEQRWLDSYFMKLPNAVKLYNLSRNAYGADIETASARMKNRWADPVRREKMLAHLKVLTQSNEFRNAARLANERRWADPVKRAGGIALLVEGNMDPVVREKISSKLRGGTHTAIARSNMSNAQLRRHRDHPISDDTRKKMSEAATGRVPNPEKGRRHSAKLKGRTHTPEHVAKVAAAHRGKTRSDETKRLISEAAKRRSPETIAKMSASAKARCTAEWIELQRLRHTGRRASEETRAKMSAASKGRPKSEEHRRKIRESSQKRWAKGEPKTPFV